MEQQQRKRRRPDAGCLLAAGLLLASAATTTTTVRAFQWRPPTLPWSGSTVARFHSRRVPWRATTGRLPWPRAAGGDGGEGDLPSIDRVSSSSSSSSQQQLPPGLAAVAQELRSLPDDRARALRLVELGDAYAAGTSAAAAEEVGEMTRVPGCVSVVHVAVELLRTEEEQQQAHTTVVHVRGRSDARLSQGLVAVLAQGLTGADPAAVLALKAEELATALGLRSSLPPGRQNGLSSILRTVQSLVRSALDGKQEEEQQRRRKAAVLPAVEGFASTEVAVLLSGGVDSSVALSLLQKQGYKPRAFYLKIWLEDELAHLNQCPWEEDWAYAEAVCRQAGNVPLEAVPLQKEYWDQVVAHTIAEAQSGRTPNPDVLCNSLVKFGVFYDVMGKHFDRVATGHYARAVHEEGQPVRLMRSPDRVKDQTYFLSRLRQDQLSRATFPIGEYTKQEIRAMAAELDLPTQARKDSQGICFLGKLRFDDFLRHYLGEQPGDVIWLESGLVVGKHRGLWFHTIGQRKGIVPVLDNPYRPLGPWYVAAKDPQQNRLYVTNSPETLGESGDGDTGDVDVARRTFRVDGVSWIAGHPPPALIAAHRSTTGAAVRMEVQIRHGPNSHPDALVSARDDGCTSLEVVLGREDSLAPGQYAAFYGQGGECLGAGVISEETFAVPQGPARRPVGR